MRKREDRRFTQEYVAERIGMTGANLSRIESGEIPYTQDTIEALADLLNVEVATILTRHPEDPHPIWEIWDRTTPNQREQILEHAQVIVKRGHSRA